MSTIRMLAVTAASGTTSSGVVWGLIGASFVLELVVFAVCVSIVRGRRK